MPYHIHKLNFKKSGFFSFVTREYLNYYHYYYYQYYFNAVFLFEHPEVYFKLVIY